MLEVEAKSGPSLLDSSDIVQKVIPVDVRLIFCFKYSSFPYIILCNSVLDRTYFLNICKYMLIKYGSVGT